MRDHAEVVIIGAGIMGLSIAYHLAQLGVTDVAVVDKSYLCGGASGRNGGGIRAQWSSETNVRLMQESIRVGSPHWRWSSVLASRERRTFSLRARKR